MSNQESPFLDKFRNKRSVVPTDYKEIEEPNLRLKFVKAVAKAAGVEVDSKNSIAKTKSVVPLYVYDQEPRIRRPNFDYYSLVQTANMSWPIRKTFNAIISECIRNWGEIKPRFKWMCKKCGYHFQTDPIDWKCQCGAKGEKNFRGPSIEQYKIAAALIRRPSRDRKFMEFVRTAIYYELACDDFYISKTFKRHPSKRGLSGMVINEIFNEHPGFIFPVGDRFGYLGGYEFFCPHCYNSPKFIGKDQPVIDIRKFVQNDIEIPKVIMCPECEEPMVRTAYVQEIGGQVTARFGAREVAHGSVSRLAPDLFGNPRLATLMKAIKTIQADDDYQLETTTEGKVGGLLGFPGLDQQRVGKILADVKRERESITKRDIVTGNLETSKRTALIFVGLGEEGQNPIKVAFRDEKEAQLALKYYQMYLNAIDQVYGIQSTTEVVDSGKQTKEIRTKVEVNRETAELHQRIFAETFNDDVLADGGITDWIWVFNKLDPKDPLRDAEILHQKAVTAKVAAEAGLTVIWTDDNELKISGKAKIQRPRESHEGQNNQPDGQAAHSAGESHTIAPTKESERTGRLVTA